MGLEQVLVPLRVPFEEEIGEKEQTQQQVLT